MTLTAKRFHPATRALLLTALAACSLSAAAAHQHKDAAKGLEHGSQVLVERARERLAASFQGVERAGSLRRAEDEDHDEDHDDHDHDDHDDHDDDDHDDDLSGASGLRGSALWAFLGGLVTALLVNNINLQ
mmetsp:Transcript_30513/g.76749  ORF Transcript_30513/g.76749 Transcript_30513/m.76749 type:complete len:131 (-) Transcript_30513:200-592(-)